MSVSVKGRPGARWRESQRKRRHLTEIVGIEGWRVSSTPDAELDALLPMQLELVPDVDAITETVVMRDPVRVTLVPTTDDEWPDDAESTRYFKERMRVGEGVVIPLRPWGLGGDEFGGIGA